MNRQTIVERALYVLVPLIGFAVVYGPPMLGLRVAIDQGWYVAAGAATVPFVRRIPDIEEPIGAVPTFTRHDNERDVDGILITNAAVVDVAARLRLTLDTITEHDATVYELAFGTPDECGDFPTIDAEQIPTLIDALGELYRTYCEHTYRDDTSGGVR